jgi:hypothetical protein
MLSPRALLFIFVAFQLAIPAVGQDEEKPAFTLKTTARLVLVDVLAQDSKTGRPMNTLKREDFRILDNKKEIIISTFDSGANFSTRPLALWFVVICNERGRGPKGEFASGWFSGKEALFRPALGDLDKGDRVGVAHWCDEGTAELDLRPTPDRDAAISTLEKTLRPLEYEAPPPGHETRGGELTLQRLIRLIIDDAHHANPQPLPVIVFLHSDHTGMPVDEINRLVDDLLETSGIVFGIKDADAHDFPLGLLGNGEQGSVLHYMASETGGQYFSVRSKLYATALQAILEQLHFRYQLGFRPPLIDGKRHQLTVEFSPGSKDVYKSVRLSYRPEYIPSDK